METDLGTGVILTVLPLQPFKLDTIEHLAVPMAFSVQPLVRAPFAGACLDLPLPAHGPACGTLSLARLNG